MGDIHGLPVEISGSRHVNLTRTTSSSQCVQLRSCLFARQLVLSTKGASSISGRFSLNLNPKILCHSTLAALAPSSRLATVPTAALEQMIHYTILHNED